MVKAYAYCRVSGRKRIGDHDLYRQIDTIKDFCRQHGYKIEQVFKEQALCESSEHDRPAFTAMVTSILSNGFDTIVIESLEALAKGCLIQELLLTYLASKNISVIAANTRENCTRRITENPAKKNLVQIHRMLARLDKSLLMEKLRIARERVRREKGRCEGAKPYGCFPEEAEILERIRRMRKEPGGNGKPMTYKSIAEKLNAEGIRTRRSKKWSASLVYNVLQKKKR